MNILIPMGGKGTRFSKEGYRVAKPLINIVGRPMIFRLLDDLAITSADTLWIGMARELDAEFHLGTRLREEFSQFSLRVVHLDFQTRGAAETLYIMLQASPNIGRIANRGLWLRLRTISLDCDTIFFSDVLSEFRRLPAGCGASFYFQDDGDKPIYSYLRFAPGTRDVVDIREKVSISRHANTGAYGFASGARLRDVCRAALDAPVDRRSGEFYTSALIARMITDGNRFIGIPVP
ncbi:unnamed protein product, partial [Phaeothamnion confervicola]